MEKQANRKRIGVCIVFVFLFVWILVSFYRCVLFSDIEEKSHTYVFGATYMTMNNAFYTVVNDVIKAEVENRGDHLITLDPALDAEKQVEQMKYLIQKKVDAIILNPVDWKRIKPGLSMAKEAGIPVIVVDAPVYDKNLVTTTIVSDNYKAGVLCANDMMNRKKSAKILLLNHNGAKSGRDRIRGFIDTVKQSSNYEVIDQVNTEGQAERAFIKMERLLKQHKEYDVVMALNDPSALGAIAAFDKVEYAGDLLVYGIDGSPDGKKMVNQGKLTGTVIQFPRKMAQTALNTLYQMIEKKAVEKEIVIDVEMASLEQLEKYDITKWQ